MNPSQSLGMPKVAVVTAGMDFADVPCQRKTVSVPGVAADDVVYFGVDAATFNSEESLSFVAWASAANTVSIHAIGLNVTPTEKSLAGHVRVFKRGMMGVLFGSRTDATALSSGFSITREITVPGARVGDMVVLNIIGQLDNGFMFLTGNAEVSAANTVSVDLYMTTGDLTGEPIELRVAVLGGVSQNNSFIPGVVTYTPTLEFDGDPVQGESQWPYNLGAYHDLVATDSDAVILSATDSGHGDYYFHGVNGTEGTASFLMNAVTASQVGTINPTVRALVLPGGML